MDICSEIKYSADGLVPAVCQDCESKEVLMLAYMNEEALRATLRTKRAHYYSRSRKKLWLKGEESGNFQEVTEVRYDCDKDTVLLFVRQTGAACHTGHASCFYRAVEDGGNAEPASLEEALCSEKLYSHRTLGELYQTVLDRKAHPAEGSYTNYLFDKGIDKILKKIGEESAEVIIASKNEGCEELIYEAADLMYHLTVLMVHKGVEWNDIYHELKKRVGVRKGEKA